MLSQVKKRDGKLEAFSIYKIKNSLNKVMKELKVEDNSSDIAKSVEEFLQNKYKNVVLSTEDIRNVIEDVLIKKRMNSVARAYILHDDKHKVVQELKNYFGKDNSLELSENALTVLKKRYLKRDSLGNIIETPEEMFRRVAKHVSSCEKNKKEWEEKYYNLMCSLDFLPNTPCLVNAGNKLGQLAACFVLPVEDSIEEIFDSLKNSAKIFQSGGGVGYSFSKLREKGSMIDSTKRYASGPVSFMEIFDKTTDVIKQGGVRRGASMGVLRVDHPDIFEFVGKKVHGGLNNFNVSVGVTDEFMNAVIHDKEFWLKNYKGKKVKSVKARELFDYICTNAWETGDPGILFLDEINRKHCLKKLGLIEATNPCGESDLLSNEACVLGSVNLSHMVHGKNIDWPKLANAVSIGVRFLDDVISVNKYPTKEIEKMCLANRKIGLGVMGFADMLIELGVKYDSEEAIALTKEIIKFIRKHAEETSEKLAKEKGEFSNYKKSNLKKKRRNATLLAIAPTGSISLIAGTSSGIEPLFGLAYIRESSVGELLETNKMFENYVRYRGLYSKELLIEVSSQGSIQGIKNLPKDIKELFVTALDIPLEGHIKMQATFQSEVDNAVSKTINLHSEASIGDIKRAYMLAWKMKCKGITIYKYGSKDKQVLYLGKHVKGHTRVHEEYSGGCVHRDCIF